MCRPGTKSAARLIAAALAGVALGTMVAGCSDLYTDRRDTIALGAGDAIAANNALQTIDPWPAQSGNPNIAFNGQRMQAAVERYRTDKVVPPVDPEAALTAAQSNSATQSSSSSSGSGTTSTTAAPQTASQ